MSLNNATIAVIEMKKASIEIAKDKSNNMPSRSASAQPKRTMAMPGGELVNGPGIRMINASIRQKNAASRSSASSTWHQAKPNWVTTCMSFNSWKINCQF